MNDCSCDWIMECTTIRKHIFIPTKIIGNYSKLRKIHWGKCNMSQMISRSVFNLLENLLCSNLHSNQSTATNCLRGYVVVEFEKLFVTRKLIDQEIKTKWKWNFQHIRKATPYNPSNHASPYNQLDYTVQKNLDRQICLMILNKS